MGVTRRVCGVMLVVRPSTKPAWWSLGRTRGSRRGGSIDRTVPYRTVQTTTTTTTPGPAQPTPAPASQKKKKKKKKRKGAHPIQTTTTPPQRNTQDSKKLGGWARGRAPCRSAGRPRDDDDEAWSMGGRDGRCCYGDERQTERQTDRQTDRETESRRALRQ